MEEGRQVRLKNKMTKQLTEIAKQNLNLMDNLLVYCISVIPLGSME